MGCTRCLCLLAYLAEKVFIKRLAWVSSCVRSEWFDPFGSAGFNLALAGIPFALLWVHLNPQLGPSRWLSLPITVWIGRRAYGLYLWHEVLNILTPNPGGKAATLVRTAVLMVASMGVAELSWRFIESPFLRRKSARYGDRHQESTPA